MILSVVATCIFYRLTKQQLIYMDFNVSQLDYSLLVPVGMGICVIAIASINVFCSYNYISSKNMSNFLLYKMVGAKNYKIIIAMAIETFLMLIIAFFSGIIIEYPIAQLIIDFSFAKLSVTDYIYIFLIDLVSVVLTLSFKIIKVSCSTVTDKKINGGQK